MAQNTFSLEQCIQQALENNLQIKQSLNSEKSQENVYFQSKMNFAPNLNASTSVSRSWGRNQDPSTFQLIDTRSDFVQSGISSNVTLFNGLANHYTLERNKTNVNTSHITTSKTKNNISLSVALQFIQVVLDKEQIKVSEQVIAMDEQRLARTTKLKERGMVTEGDVLNLQAQLATDKLTLLNQQNQLSKDKLALLQSMDADVTQNFDIQIPELGEPQGNTASLQNIYDYALSNMPEVKEQEGRLQSSNLSIKIAKASLYPTLSLSANMNARATFFEPYNTQSYDFTTGQFVTKRVVPDNFKTQYDRNLGKSLGLSLQVPIFNRYSVRTNIANANVDKMNQELQLKIVKNQLTKDIQQAYIDVENAKARYESVKEQIKSLTLAYEFAQKRFEAGAINSLDMLTAQNNLQRAQSDLLQAKYNLVFRGKVLDFYQGKPLKM